MIENRTKEEKIIDVYKEALESLKDDAERVDTDSVSSLGDFVDGVIFGIEQAFELVKDIEEQE